MTEKSPRLSLVRTPMKRRCGQGRHPKILAYLVILCFEKRKVKHFGPKKILGWLRHWHKDSPLGTLTLFPIWCIYVPKQGPSLREDMSSQLLDRGTHNIFCPPQYFAS